MKTINCQCDTCDVKGICAYYQGAVKPVLQVVRDPDIPQDELFTKKLVEAVKDFYCDQYE